MAAREDKRREGPGVEDFLKMLRERAWIIVLCVVVAVGVSSVFAFRTTEQYTASANLIPVVNNVDSAVIGSDYFTYYYDPVAQRQMDPFIPQRARRDPTEPSAATLRKNLYCLPSGPLPPNPAELLGSARMGEVISQLESLADYVLIDTSPVLPVWDAVTVARWVDAVILTVRLRSTTRQDLQEVCHLLERTGTRIIGVVACGAKAGKAYYGKRAYEYAYTEQADA